MEFYAHPKKTQSFLNDHQRNAFSCIDLNRPDTSSASKLGQIESDDYQFGMMQCD